MSTNGTYQIKTGSSPLLAWMVQMFQMLSQEAIVVPKHYRDQVLQTKDLLKRDTSGLVNTILDFSIQAACVEYTVETHDGPLDEMLNKWLLDINHSLLGKIPTGISALARQYFMERWKGSSHLVLMTQWNRVEGWQLPTEMWFLDGEDLDVHAASNDGVRRIGDEQYGLITSYDPKRTVPLTRTDSREFFVQKPYEAWSVLYPTPFLIRRGVFRNLKFLDVLAGKSEQVVQKALEYLMLIKKGSERLAGLNNPAFIPSDADLQNLSDNFAKFLQERKLSPANRTTTYTAPFDTEMEQLIPEYERALKQALYSPVEHRILSGLGMIDILEGAGANSRRESVLNPKPLRAEVQNGIADFARLLSDVVKMIIDKNKASHPKKTGQYLMVRPGVIKEFLSDDGKELIRSAYDRGLISKETATELIVDVDFDAEVARRKAEKAAGYEEIMYAPVTVNQESVGDPGRPQPKPPKDNVLPDRQGPEARNFKQAAAEPVYEEAPYKDNSGLPDAVKNHMNDEVQTIFRKTVNDALKKYTDESTAFKVAWSVVKRLARKNKDGDWVLKKKTEAALEHASLDIESIRELMELDTAAKKNELLTKYLDQMKSDENL